MSSFSHLVQYVSNIVQTDPPKARHDIHPLHNPLLLPLPNNIPNLLLRNKHHNRPAQTMLEHHPHPSTLKHNYMRRYRTVQFLNVFSELIMVK